MTTDPVALLELAKNFQSLTPQQLRMLQAYCLTQMGGSVVVNNYNNTYVSEITDLVLETGNTFTTGSGEPEAGSGVDGDYYLDGDSGKIWVNISGTWYVTGETVEPGSLHKIEPSRPSFTLNFASQIDYFTIALAMDIQFATLNRRAPKAKIVRLVNNGVEHTLAFPATWRWVGSAAPTSIAASKVGILSVTCFGSTDADLVAAWAVEP